MPHEQAFPVRDDELGDEVEGAEPRRSRPHARSVTWALVTIPNGALRCSFCRESHLLVFRAAPLDEVVRELRAFGQKHALCKPTPR